MSGPRAAVLAALAGLLAGCAGPGPGGLRGLEAALAAQDSATAALEAWCAANQLADPPVISATVLNGPPAPAPRDARGRLAIGADAPLGYRHVALRCGERVLSEAHNWYVPERLTPAMNVALATTRVPFGRVAAPLGFRRERLDTLPPGSRACPRGTVLGHRAMLRLPDGRPLALLVECYTRANLTR